MPTAPQTTAELLRALKENGERPYGRTRTVTAEELAEAAEQFAEPLPLFHALLELQEAYTYGAEPRKSPVVFARLLSLYDEQPDAFDARARHTLFWRFKWVSNALRALPEIPLASLRQWLTEMRDRYEKAGYGLQPYYAQAYQLAVHTGEDAGPAHDLWAARTRTELSDCEACEICERAQYHLADGHDERALDTWDPVLAGKESCQEEPARSISYALLPLLRTGRTDRARALHLAGYRACRRNPSMSGEVGRHLEFCALTGNEARGLELLAENRGLFEEVDSPLDQYDFLTGVEVLLQRVELLGHGELPAAGYPGRTWTVSALRAEVRDRADGLAARFDARNGTTAHTDRRRTRLDRAPLLDALELTLRTRALDEVTPTASAAAPATPEGLPESLPELVLKARELDELGHPNARVYWTRLRTLVAAPGYVHPDDPAVGPLARLRADLLDHEADRAGAKDRHAAAAHLHEEAATLYDEAGEPAHATLSRATALLARAEIRPGDATGSADASDPADASDLADAADRPDAPDRAGAADSADRADAPDSADATAADAPDSADATAADAPDSADATAADAPDPADATDAADTADSAAVTDPADAPAPADPADAPHPAAAPAPDPAAARTAALTRAHAAVVRLQEETPGLAPYQEARLLRLRATLLGLRLQASGSEEHLAPLRAEVDLLYAFADRHGIAGQVSGALLLRASTHALTGDLPAAVAETDALLDRLGKDGPAWHPHRVLALRGRFQLGLSDARAAHESLAEALRLAAEWPADTDGTSRLHADLAQACLRLGRHEEALRHLTRSAELDLRDGDRTDAFHTYTGVARLSLDLGRAEDCIALTDSLLREPDVVAGEVNDRIVAQLRLTRAHALHAGGDLKAATVEFVLLAAESAGWEDDRHSHAMIAAKTAVLLAEAGEFDRAREAAEQVRAVHAEDPRHDQLSGVLREIARLQAKRRGPDGLPDALALLADAGRLAEEAAATGHRGRFRSLETALAYEYGRVHAYAGDNENALTALEQAIGLLGDPGEDKDHAGEWAECVRFAGAVEGLFLERPAPARTRLTAAAARLTALGHTEEAAELTDLAARLDTGD
ncbi:hypothetical protein [Streptomyces sp. NPDC005435]|uniref:hypothetical protein n=1 Tax=Streptomyces sp. NPDC005435 TaxID=3154464 RepID=UPI003453DEE2